MNRYFRRKGNRVLIVRRLRTHANKRCGAFQLAGSLRACSRPSWHSRCWRLVQRTSSVSEERLMMIMSNLARSSTRSTIRRHDTLTGGHDDDRVAELLAILRFASPHVLLIGHDSDLTTVFQHIQPYLRTAIAPWVPDLASHLPAAPFGTLLVKDVSHLDFRQQVCLAKIADAPNVQIISMATAPVFPLIGS